MSSDIHLLDTIKAGFGLETDAAVADFLGITPTTIHRVRHGKARLGIMQRIKVLDHIAFLRTRSLLEQITPQYLSAAIRRLSHERARKIADQRVKRPTPPTADAELLDIAKDVLGFGTDEALAEFLGLARHRISMVRSGSSTLGPKPRLKLLNRIQPFDLDAVMSTLESSEELVSRIESFASKSPPNGSSG